MDVDGSKMDQVNTCAYRDHTLGHRPPLRPESNAYGARAAAADKRIQMVLGMLLLYSKRYAS